MYVLSTIEPEPPEGHFNIRYIGKYFSEYSDDVGFKSMGQDVILSHHLHDDDDKMYEVQCSLAQSDTYRLFSDNPLQMGYFLDSISGMEYIM